jgi:hypothetical protein
MSSATNQRDAVSAIAPSEPQRAVALARAIAEPWFRSQALAAAARYCADRQTRDKLIDEALVAASELEEPNAVVTVSAWPIKVLAISRSTDRLAAETDRLLTLIRSEPSPVRRADALRYLFGAVIHGERDVVLRVIEALASACLAPLRGNRRNRKGESVLEDCLPGIARIDSEKAEELLARVPSARARRARERILSTGTAPLDDLVPWPHIENQ